MPAQQVTTALTAEDRHDIITLLNRFAWIADEGDVQQFAACFHPDIVWDMGEDMRWEGREAVIAGLASMRDAGHAGPESGTRHLMMNIDIEDSTAGVRVRSVFCLASGGSAPTIRILGSYSDALARTQDGWVLRERVIRTL